MIPAADLISTLAATRVIAALPTGGRPGRAVVVTEILVQEALDVIAVPASEVAIIGEITPYLGGRALVGVHGVTTPEEVQAAVEAGAAFVLSPVANADVVAVAGDHDVAVFAGGLSPNELVSAWQLGPTGVLVHPADVLGTGYAGHTHAAVPDAPLVAGGTSPYAMGQWLASGALAIVADTSLVSDTLVGGDLSQLRDRARNYAAEARAAATWTSRS